MDPETLRTLLDRLKQGEVDTDEVAAQLVHAAGPRTQATRDANVDLDRRRRCGFSEVVFCEGKTAEAIFEIFEVLRRNDQDCLGTRVTPEQAEYLVSRIPDTCYNVVAGTVRLPHSNPDDLRGRVAVITAGTCDRPVAEEAVETLHWMRCRVEMIVDVGVAGPQRLAEQQSRFSGADAVVVVAGMEGALPSVVGGWVDCPVIAVPTSVGYGASFDGVAALLGMLNSCASNVSVVNIDGGFKGGYVAGLIARRSDAKKPHVPQADGPPTIRDD